MVHKPCAVPKCESKDGVRFRFPHPVNAKQRFEKWLEILKNPLLYSLDAMSVYSMKRVCGNHFSKDCFVKPNKIKYSSVPTLHVPDPDAAKTWNYSNTTDYVIRNKPAIIYLGKTSSNNLNNCNRVINSEVIAEPLFDETTSEITIDNRCRVCLKIKENHLPLNYKTNIFNEESLTLLEIIHNFCNVEISLNDDKPQRICVECAEKLRAMYEITVCCENNDIILKEETMTEAINKKTNKVITKQKIRSEKRNVILQPNKKVTKKPPLINVIRNERVLKINEKIVLQADEKMVTTDNWVRRKNVKIISKCEWCETNQFNRLRLKGLCKQRNTVVCMQCYRYFKRQHRHKLIDGVFIRKKPYICSCGARFGNSVKLLVHAINH